MLPPELFPGIIYGGRPGQEQFSQLCTMDTQGPAPGVMHWH